MFAWIRRVFRLGRKSLEPNRQSRRQLAAAQLHRAGSNRTARAFALVARRRRLTPGQIDLIAEQLGYGPKAAAAAKRAVAK